MNKITVDIPKEKWIEINGKPYEIRLSDIEIVEKVFEMFEKFNIRRGKDTPNVHEILRLSGELEGLAGELLGKDAIAKIAENRALGLYDRAKIVTQICEGCLKEYNESILAEYEK